MIAILAMMLTVGGLAACGTETDTPPVAEANPAPTATKAVPAAVGESGFSKDSETLAKLYRELLVFKDDPIFHQRCYAQGGPYRPWALVEQIERLRDHGDGTKMFQETGTLPAELWQIGLDYCNNAGGETQLTRTFIKGMNEEWLTALVYLPETTSPPVARAIPGTTTPISPAVRSVDQSVRALVAMQGPSPSDEEISQACDALRKAGWEYMGIGSTNNRTMMIAASITTFASGDRVADYCNGFPQVIAPIVVATPDIESTKRAIAAADQRRRDAELATRVATEAKQEADRFAASLEATRTAEDAILQATRAAELAQHCREWEGMVMDWIREGNNYSTSDRSASLAPAHPELSPQMADEVCITNFPLGRIYSARDQAWRRGAEVGTGPNQLLPGTYRYQAPSGDDRVEAKPLGLYDSPNVSCWTKLNASVSDYTLIPMTYGEPFEITLHPHHNRVVTDIRCLGFLYRVGA